MENKGQKGDSDIPLYKYQMMAPKKLEGFKWPIWYLRRGQLEPWGMVGKYILCHNLAKAGGHYGIYIQKVVIYFSQRLQKLESTISG